MQRTISIVVLGLLLGTGTSSAGEGKYHPIQLGEKDREILDVVDDLDLLFERRGHVLHDAEATEMLERVCTKVLAGESTEPHMDFDFRVIREPLPNAFAMPNGSVYFTTGMLGALEDEAQLAAICAHESNHVLGHHTFLSMKSQRRKTAGYIAGSMVLGVGAAQVGGLGGALLQEATGIGLQILYISSVLGYSRDIEEEADRRAVEMIVRAGYDPRAMIEVFEILDEDPEGLRTETKTFWLDHPKLQDRMDYTRQILADEYPDLEEMELARNPESYGAHTEELARHNVLLQMRSDLPRTAVYSALDLVERHGQSAENLILLGDAWRNLGGRTLEPSGADTTKEAVKERRRARVLKTRREREEAALHAFGGASSWEINRTDAESAYRKALEIDPGAAAAWRGLGYLHERDGEHALAIEAFGRYLEADPDAPDRYVVRRHLLALREAGSEEEGRLR